VGGYRGDMHAPRWGAQQASLGLAHRMLFRRTFAEELLSTGSINFDAESARGRPALLDVIAGRLADAGRTKTSPIAEPRPLGVEDLLACSARACSAAAMLAAAAAELAAAEPAADAHHIGGFAGTQRCDCNGGGAAPRGAGALALRVTCAGGRCGEANPTSGASSVWSGCSTRSSGNVSLRRLNCCACGGCCRVARACDRLATVSKKEGARSPCNGDAGNSANGMPGSRKRSKSGCPFAVSSIDLPGSSTMPTSAYSKSGLLCDSPNGLSNAASRPSKLDCGLPPGSGLLVSKALASISGSVRNHGS